MKKRKIIGCVDDQGELHEGIQDGGKGDVGAEGQRLLRVLGDPLLERRVHARLPALAGGLEVRHHLG